MSDIRLFELNNYIRPEIVENKTKNWVLNGRHNSFYQYIIDRKNGSPTNSAIIDSYVDLTYGKGLATTTKDLASWVQLKSILRPKELRKIISDFILFGEASMQVVKNKKGGVFNISHLPKQKIVPQIANKDREIENYYVSDDWSRLAQNPPQEFSSFGTSKDAIEIYNIKPYKAGKDYFSDPDYLAALPYCEMEEEIANLNINSIKNGLSAGYIINVPDGNSLSDEEKEEFERLIKLKLTGSPNASRFVLSFNGRDVEITIAPFPVNENIHKQWEFLTNEARQQIITGHRLTSPVLAGISSADGFSSTADEMDMAESQLMKRVIQPKQNFIIDALEEVLNFYGINLDLYFKPLTEEKEVSTTQLSTHVCLSEEATDEMAKELIQFGEELNNEEWILLSSADVDYDTDDDLYGLIQFASTGTARPNAKSSQDSDDIAIRYRYVGNPNPERDFCRLMMGANKLYRKEDIIQMGSQTVNDGFGEKGTPNKPYSIWLWKGGGLRSEKFPNGTCKHKWQREIYLKRGGGVDVNSPLAKTISTSEARRRGYKVPVNDSDVSITPNKNKS